MSKSTAHAGISRRLSGLVACVLMAGSTLAASAFAQAERAPSNASTSEDRHWPPLAEQVLLSGTPSRKLRGVVRTSSGAPVRGAVVGMYRKIGGVPRKLYGAGHCGYVPFHSSTDEAGEFVAYVPTSGEYAFYVTPHFRLESLASVWVEPDCEDRETLAPAWSSEPGGTGIKWVSVAASGIEPVVVVTCNYVPAWRLEGRVTSSSGAALANYEVAVESIDSLELDAGEAVVHVDDAGRWYLCGLADGRYRVTAFPDVNTRFDSLPHSLKAEIVVGEVEIRGANAAIELQVAAK